MKNMLKKLSVLLFCIVCVFAIVGCDTTGGNKNENTKYTSDTYPWPTTQTDSLKLTKDYAGKDFITDGIGEVSNVVRYVDGDTTVFKLANGKEVTIRYNGVNTPESTYRIEPWGYAASRYNKKLYADALAKGAKIVLEAEPNSDRVDTTGTRYLAWIWLVFPNGDSRLVNLELAELGYGLVKNASGTQYEKNFNDAMYDISKYKLRVYGEKDPGFDYSNEAKEMTIKEIRETYGTEEAVNENTGVNGDSSFVSPLIKVTGVVAKKSGSANAYIQQYDAEDDQYYGIYVYGGYNSITNLIEGCSVQITGKIGYYYGSLQITDINSDSQISILSPVDKNQIVTREEKISNIDDIYAYSKIGSLVTLHNLTVYDYNDSQNNSATTLKCHYIDENGNQKQFNVRIAKEIALYDPITKKQISSGEYFVGKTFETITGMLAYYNGADKTPYSNGHMQLALSSMDDVIFK